MTVTTHGTVPGTTRRGARPWYEGECHEPDRQMRELPPSTGGGISAGQVDVLGNLWSGGSRPQTTCWRLASFSSIRERLVKSIPTAG